MVACSILNIFFAFKAIRSIHSATIISSLTVTNKDNTQFFFSNAGPNLEQNYDFKERNRNFELCIKIQRPFTSL